MELYKRWRARCVTNYGHVFWVTATSFDGTETEAKRVARELVKNEHTKITVRPIRKSKIDA